MKICEITKENEFKFIHDVINGHWERAIGLANFESLMTYWSVGAFVSAKLNTAAWGTKTVEELSDYLKTHNPKLRGYGKRNIYNMVMFYEAYTSNEFQQVYKRLKLNEFVQITPVTVVNGEIVQPPAAQFEEQSAIVQPPAAQFEEQSAINDDGQKGNIGSEKGNIGSEKGNIDGLSSITKANIALLRDTYANRDMFKRADVLKILPLNLASLSKLLRKMLDRGIIEPVQGRGKGAYRFVNDNHKV